MRFSLLVVPLALAGAFVLGRATGPSAAAAGAARHTFTLRTDDTVRAPARAVSCVASSEAGAPNVVCDHIGKSHRYTVVLYRDEFLVLRGPDRVVWSGKP
jgi:hypothetical protein